MIRASLARALCAALFVTALAGCSDNLSPEQRKVAVRDSLIALRFAKNAATKYYYTHGETWPTSNEQAGFKPAASYVDGYVSRVEIGVETVDRPNGKTAQVGVILVHYSDKDSRLKGKVARLEAVETFNPVAPITWKCIGGFLPEDLHPPECAGTS